MPDQTSGLRFDVYERVHLPDDVAAIEELEEIELVPRIQVVQQGEQAILKGQLLLTGVYRSQYDLQQPQSLEHWIPVEITLPMNRVQSINDIAVEIDHFDVDLLSSRTLNITGILSLHGIQVEDREEPEKSWAAEEPITVVHRRETHQAADVPGQPPGGNAAAAFQQEEYGQAQFDANAPREQQSGAAQYRQAEPPPPWGQLYAVPEARKEGVPAYPSYGFPLQTNNGIEQDESQSELARQAERANADASFNTGATANGYNVNPGLANERESHSPIINWSAFSSQPQFEQAQQPVPAADVQERPDSVWSLFENQAIGASENASVSADANTDANAFAETPVRTQFGDISSHARPVPEAQRDEAVAGRGELPAASDQLFEGEPEQPQRTDPIIASPQTLFAIPSIAEASQEETEAERKELRVAFGRKRPEEAEPEREPVGLRTLLQSSRREQETRESSEQAAVPMDKSRATTGDEIEWKTLFLGKLADEQSFRKVRMCIVQREETLDDIAVRYGKNARELSLHNRLQDQVVSEGQVLYIP